MAAGSAAGEVLAERAGDDADPPRSAGAIRGGCAAAELCDCRRDFGMDGVSMFEEDPCKIKQNQL